MQSSVVQIPSYEDEVSYWLASLMVHEGQEVEKGQQLARIEGKAQSQMLASPQNGYVVGLHALPGQIVRPKQVLCYICGQPSIGSPMPGPRANFPGSTAFDPTALLIFGGGGHGKTVIDLVQALGTMRIVGVIDDGLPAGSEVLGIPVLGGAKDLTEWYNRGVRLIVNAVGGIGNVAVRLKVFDILAKEGFVCPTLVHPTAVVERSALLEAGVQVFAQAYIGSAARVGFGTVVNTSAVVHHDCVIGRVVNLSPGATLAGNVRVEDHAQIGMLATVNLQVTVGEGALLGNGCTVKANVPAGQRVWAGTIWPVPAQKENIK
jgi:acetyltransferase EpsM